MKRRFGKNNTGVNLSICMVSYNSENVIPECLEALREQMYLSFTVTGVDNSSHGGSVAFINTNHPDVEIISLPAKFGFSAANNRVLKNIKPPDVALLNNDSVPHRLWLEKLVKTLDAY